jgi:hypothetical protein
MSDNKPDKRESDLHLEQRSAKAPRLKDRLQDTPGPTSFSAASSELSNAPESLHSPEDSIVRTATSSVAAKATQVAPPIAEPASTSAPINPHFRLLQPHATATPRTRVSKRDWQEELIHLAQQPRDWSGGVPPVDTPARRTSERHLIPLSRASNTALPKLTPLPHRTTTWATIDAAVPSTATTGNREPALQALTAVVPERTGTRDFPIELRSSPTLGAPVQIGTTAPAAHGYVPALYVPAKNAPTSRAYTSQESIAQHPEVPVAQTLQTLAKIPPATVQAPQSEAQTFNGQAQISNDQAQPFVVTRRTLGSGRRLCKCPCTKKDTFVRHNCCINSVLPTKAERDALANATNPQLRAKAMENAFRTTSWKPVQNYVEDAARTPPPYTDSTAVLGEVRNANAHAALCTVQGPAQTYFPPADRSQRHMVRAPCPSPVIQHHAISNVGQTAPVHPSYPNLDTKVIATLMKQVRDGFATLQAMPPSTYSARVTEVVMASLQEGFLNFVSTFAQQRDLDWQTTIDENNKRIQAGRLAWHTSLTEMDAQSQKVINERDRHITDLEKQLEKLKIGTADPANQLSGFQSGMKQSHQEHLTEHNRLTRDGLLGDTPESMTQDILRSRGLLSLDQRNQRLTVHPHANRHPALPRPHYISTAEANARMAAMYADLESDNDKNDDEDSGPEVQKCSEIYAEPNVVNGENMEVDSD